MMARELKTDAHTAGTVGGHVDMGKRRDPQSLHAEGEHGPRTRARFVEQLHEAPPAEPTENIIKRKRQRAASEGKRRLVEARKQHDEGEKQSERTRLAKDHKKRSG